MFPIDFCHIPISIIKRSAGRSAVAAAAYRSGTKLTNEWDGMTHDYTRKGGIVHAEIMLPAHAPPEFADRSTLWNSVEQIEKARDSQLAREIEAALPRELSGEQQLALVRAYVKDNFVDKGMCADFAIHDKGTGNPHVHIMLTLRPLKENGQWGAKCRKAYDLDENGQRIPDGKGGWKNHREDTTDWNDKGNVEIWRVAWAAYTNRALESAGRPERIDHRSYKRQGIATLKYECVLVDPNDLNRKHIYIQVKKGDVDLNTDDYSSLNGEVYLLTTEGNVQNAQKYSNVKVADPTVIYEFAINPDKSHIIPENVLYWVKFLTEIENNRLKFSACKGIMFDTNISYSDTNESEMILGNKIAAYGDAKRYIDSFRKDDYALFYSKGRGIIAVGQIVTDTPTEVGDEKYHSVRMIVPENFNGDVKALPALSPNEIKTILKRNFYWASTIKTPFLTGVQVEMLIRELKKKHISAFGKYKIEY